MARFRGSSRSFRGHPPKAGALAARDGSPARAARCSQRRDEAGGHDGHGCTGHDQPGSTQVSARYAPGWALLAVADALTRCSFLES